MKYAFETACVTWYVYPLLLCPSDIHDIFLVLGRYPPSFV